MGEPLHALPRSIALWDHMLGYPVRLVNTVLQGRRRRWDALRRNIALRVRLCQSIVLLGRIVRLIHLSLLYAPSISTALLGRQCLLRARMVVYVRKVRLPPMRSVLAVTYATEAP